MGTIINKKLPQRQMIQKVKGRSAISLISVRDISQDGLISRFLEGVFRKRPIKPKYSST